MKRFVIHAGFPKTASTAIQRGISAHLLRLNAQDIYMLGEDLKVGLSGKHPKTPLWYLQSTSTTLPQGETLVDLVMDRFKITGDSTLVLSSENLQQLQMPRLFAGIDKIVPTDVVFYMRPQADWIPSAWKQWELKEGTGLEEFVNICIETDRLQNLRKIENWAVTLPDAKVVVRPLFKDTLENGDPVADFFSFLGLDDFRPELPEKVINPSLDYSILHVLAKNSDKFFTGRHDNKLYNDLLGVLPDEYRRTNIEMLSQALANRVEAHFRAENLEILKKYSELDDPISYYEAHFMPRPRTTSYMDMSEADILGRFANIMSQSAGSELVVAQHGTDILNLAGN